MHTEGLFCPVEGQKEHGLFCATGGMSNNEHLHLWLMAVTGREDVPAMDIFICDKRQESFSNEDLFQDGTEGAYCGTLESPP